MDLAFAEASVVVAISPAMAERIRLRVPGADVQTIPLWAPVSVVPGVDKVPLLRRARRIPERAFVLMYHGNLGLAYDFEPLLQGARLLAAEPGFALAIIGAGAQLESLKYKASERRLSNVYFFPTVAGSDLSDSLAMGDCHVVSVRKGWSGVAFPAKFITAAAAGRPILLLSPPDTELAGMVRSSACGSVVADGGALAEVVRALMRADGGAREQGEASRRLYVKQFDRELGLSRWDALLGTLRN
jgi:hypothetical protein